MRLLLVEDDQDLARGVSAALEAEGYALDAVGSGEAALFLIGERQFDAVVLDLGLPDISGLAVLKTIRASKTSLPVVILTARDSIEDRVGGLDAGADDYLTKPFEIPELIARLRAVTRRSNGRAVNSLVVGDVELDPESHRVLKAGVYIALSGKEYQLLHTFMSRAGRLLTKEQIEEAMYAWGDEVASNAIEVYISKLRKHLGKEFIKTVRGIGYGVGL